MTTPYTEDQMADAMCAIFKEAEKQAGLKVQLLPKHLQQKVLDAILHAAKLGLQHARPEPARKLTPDPDGFKLEA